MFTVTYFAPSTSSTEVSFFDTERKARNWVKWLSAQKWATKVRLYRGQAGAERLQ